MNVRDAFTVLMEAQRELSSQNCMTDVWYCVCVCMYVCMCATFVVLIASGVVTGKGVLQEVMSQ